MSPSEPGTLREAAAAIASGRISSLEMTTEALARADRSQPHLNAFIAIERDAALQAAKAADEAVARGIPLGPLHGVPLAHKDMFDRAAKVTGCGSRIRADHVAAETSTVMARLERAGALQIGRLNMSEFAMGPTGHNAHHGRAINPIDPARITAGSSSGSGAAVGGEVVLAALGSDTGGSIRLPAACCGVVGIKPTQGRVSRHGAMPLSFSQDCIGPLARTVEDAYLLLQLISGADGRDPTCRDIAVPAALTPEIGSLRVGLGGGVFTEALSGEVASAMDDMARLLRPACRSVETVLPPDLSDLAELANVVAISEAAAVHFDAFRSRPEDFGPQVRMRLSQAIAIPSPLYLRALQIRVVMLEEFLATVFSACDVLIVPTMPFLPPLSSEVDVGASASMNRIVSAMTALTRPFSFLGLPVVTLPVARSREGLPVGLQIVAPPWQEQRAASLARHIEQALALGSFAATFPRPTAA
ncbi:aspartyl/glutamyl-tRNA(Asn/Gln) amidotransferase subunit A [Rhizobium sp. PP-F2F-G48]|uniref:amidase n=1 Tax=Rhizobium sp. PP-F2F-G48 TaxID=2135651 RepID=UPI0010D14B35|nr:amidase [Rhizobium sp. PP-F2F-G48]TCM52663.1 aspartyl/glutamyl-tRNA(Asn/Gln) amidotransferase subunit A [Rhizobium sp. PP-F2F-G48]